MRWLLLSCNPRCEINYVYNGNQLLDFLLKKGRYKDDTACPHGIVLDLNMPFLDGFGVLEALKTMPVSIPVYILSDNDCEKAQNVVARIRS